MNFTTHISCLRSFLVISTTFEYFLGIFTSLQITVPSGLLFLIRPRKCEDNPVYSFKWSQNRPWTGLQASVMRFCDEEKTDGYLKMPPVGPSSTPRLSLLCIALGGLYKVTG